MSRLRRHTKLGARAAWDLHYGPNMTPMVDVVMVILVFFMASTAVLGPEWFLRSALPVASAKAASPAKEPDSPSREVRVEFTLSRSVGEPTLVSGPDVQNAPLDSLLAKLAALASENKPDDLAVVLRPGATVPYQDLVLIHEACQKLGISKVGMAD